MLEEMCLGSHYVEVALVFRNAFLINGFLTNIEASYELTETDLEKLEKCDEQLLRTILECPFSTPKEMLYLEVGVTPIRFIVVARRLIFHHYILNEEKEACSLHTLYLLYVCSRSVHGHVHDAIHDTKGSQQRRKKEKT